MTAECPHFFRLVLLMVVSCSAAQIFGDYSNEDQTYPPDSFRELTKPEVERPQSGTDVVLRCDVPDCKHHRKIRWEFKPCKPDFKNVPCEKYYDGAFQITDGDWKKPPRAKTKRCDLELKEVNDANNGLYRCVSKHRIIRTVQVEVIETTKYNGDPPEIADLIPSNASVPLNSQIIIQCKVFSRHPPSIWWFKQSDGAVYDIKYLDKYYRRIVISEKVYRIPNENDVYLSKLNIQNVSLANGGVYVCVGVTEQGLGIKNAFVRVLGNNTWEPRTSFSLLFLIPLAFALVPITIWLCYYRKKKKRKNVERNKAQQKKLIKIIENSRLPVV